VTREPCEATWHAPLHTPIYSIQGLETVDSPSATFFQRPNILLGLTNPTMFIRPSKKHHRSLLSPPAGHPHLGVLGYPRYGRESSDRTSPSASASPVVEAPIEITRLYASFALTRELPPVGGAREVEALVETPLFPHAAVACHQHHAVC
jgi:hypothetical protein